MMTLNEAIEYYDSLAEECRRKASIERNDYMDLRDESAECSQLSDWLAELAVLREKVNSSEIPNSSDLISRQAAIDAMEKYEKRVETAGQSWTIMCCENEILSLPSAQPERKTGHWIEHKTQIADHTVYTYECSECGNSMIVKPTRFCGHCGAKMEEKTDGDM